MLTITLREATNGWILEKTDYSYPVEKPEFFERKIDALQKWKSRIDSEIEAESQNLYTYYRNGGSLR